MDENERDLDLGINDDHLLLVVSVGVLLLREDVDRRLRIKPPPPPPPPAATASAASPNLVLVDTGRDPFFPLLLVGKKLMLVVSLYLLRAYY